MIVKTESSNCAPFRKSQVFSKPYERSNSYDFAVFPIFLNNTEIFDPTREPEITSPPAPSSSAAAFMVGMARYGNQGAPRLD